MIKSKVERLEKEMDESKKQFVAVDLFNATVDPIKRDLHEMQQDIKKILVAVSKNSQSDKDLNR